MQLGDEATGRLGGGNSRVRFEQRTAASATARRSTSAAEAARNRHRGASRRPAARRSHAREPSPSSCAPSAASRHRKSRASGRAGRHARRAHRARPTRSIAEATDRLAARLAEIDTAGVGAAARVGEAEADFSGALNALLDRTSTTLDEIRSGIDAQAAAVAALGRAGVGRHRQRRHRGRRARSRRTSTARTRRSKACRAALPSRSAPRSG